MDPVIAADGFTYERYAIEDWLSRKGTSPLTNELLPHLGLIPNHAIKSTIIFLRQCNPGMFGR